LRWLRAVVSSHHEKQIHQVAPKKHESLGEKLSQHQAGGASRLGNQLPESVD
jgi:hypothetical protein